MDIQFFEIQFFEIQFHEKPWKTMENHEKTIDNHEKTVKNNNNLTNPVGSTPCRLGLVRWKPHRMSRPPPPHPPPTLGP